ncbi:MAG: peptidase M16 [Caldibacillus debilis]|uniref:Peptidase M16 n=1 Tax=Caldibacillus debilis TaxID=301148 RepID=A0A3E0JXN6_9BACI|nr:pitrilysin family protein [Caldibacillus debilis]REJ24862.1 MAG: peptidase M16 [Caldibacillus debilis]
METIVHRQGVTFHFIRTEKFKTNTIVLKMKAPLAKESATIRALLPYVLQSGTKRRPSQPELRSYLEELYGADFFVELQKKGENHIISLHLEVANEKFLRGSEPLMEKGLRFLHEVLFEPKAENGSFDREIVEREKRALKQRIQAVYDDKMSYASLRLVEEMCKEEPYAVPVNGYMDAVDGIDGESLYRYFQRSLEEDDLDLYCVGDFDFQAVENLCSRLFSFPERRRNDFAPRPAPVKGNFREVSERQPVNQGKLNIGFRTNIFYGDGEYFPLQVFNGLFGGFPHSKLFRNVREKESLAYYAFSRLESHKGLLMVLTGIDPKNYRKTVDIIVDQWEAVKKGDFTEEELEQTKAAIRNQMSETLDTSRGLIEVLYHNVISGKSITQEQWQDRINGVTKEDVMRAAGKIAPDTVYFLTGMEGQDEGSLN